MNLRVRPWLDRIDPYRPGKPATSGDGSLASNESPIGTSRSVLTAISRAAHRVHRYPDPLADELRDELAVRHGVTPDHILVGNGSDELIYLLALAYLARDGRAVCADPAYRIDEISAHVVDAHLTKVPLLDWRHDLDAMGEIGADIAYVVNPHNPTGTVRSRAEIEAFTATGGAGLVVVDEAYIDFADDPVELTAMPLVAGGRVAVLRTFSKLYGLAGMRIGYLVAAPAVVETLRKIRAPFSVSSLAQAAALAALRDSAFSEGARRYSIAGREALTRMFEEAGYTVVPSQANFVLVEAADEYELVDRLEAAGVSVRPGGSLGVPGTVRVSVPSDAGRELVARSLGVDSDAATAMVERA